jgi:integrase
LHAQVIASSATITNTNLSNLFFRPALEPWLQREAQAYLFSPKEVVAAFHAKRRKHRTSPMTPSQAQRRPKRKPLKAPRDHYSDESYCQAVERACERAGVAKWTPGRLRHNAATRLRARYGIEAAQLVLGHQNLSTTEIYAERDMTQYAQIMREAG